MNRTLQRVWQRVLRRIGRPGVLALALLLPALVIAGWLPRLSRHADGLRAALSAKADELARPAVTVQRRPSNGEQLIGFVSGLPSLDQNASDLEQMFAFARRRNVKLLKGEYQLKPDLNTSLVSYTATFPVRSDYATLKVFAADVLEALPHVSMDELRLARTDAGSGVLDSMIRFTFVYRSL